MSVVLLPASAPNYKPTTLDELWNEAESIGEVQLENSGYGAKYRARISFINKFGHIFARGEGPSTHIALGNAIDNARQLGGGMQP